MFEVILSPEALAFYTDADRILAGKLARCFAQLESEPRRHANVKRLKGELAGLSRYRVGDWRVVYRMVESERCVFVLLIAHRRDVYE
jgi:mRNA interferase RelE/StbE